MEMPHFEITYLPKNARILDKFRKKLENYNSLKGELEAILAASEVIPTKISVQRAGKGQGKGWLTGYRYLKYEGKVRGTKKSFFGEKHWGNNFDIYLLHGKSKDAIMFTAKGDKFEMLEIGQRIYERLVESMADSGLIPWTQVVRTGTIA